MTTFDLRMIAMLCMLCDHFGRTAFPEQIWLTYIGRLAFPIFAYQLAEGYQHTRSKHKYALRLFLFALLSELPFDLMVYGTLCYWGHQNVMWTLLMGFVSIWLVDRVLACYSSIPAVTLGFLITFGCFIAATALRLDYAGLGVLQLMFFYLFLIRVRCIPAAIFVTVLLNVINPEGSVISILILQFSSQSIATLALIPILLYKGKRGYHSKAWTWFCYVYYPIHMLILSIFG